MALSRHGGYACNSPLFAEISDVGVAGKLDVAGDVQHAHARRIRVVR
jgi:hypothetical protein